jgi:hypothetical protein
VVSVALARFDQAGAGRAKGNVSRMGMGMCTARRGTLRAGQIQRSRRANSNRSCSLVRSCSTLRTSNHLALATRIRCSMWLRPSGNRCERIATEVA